jgi:hypothetical protein
MMINPLQRPSSLPPVATNLANWQTTFAIIFRLAWTADPLSPADGAWARELILKAKPQAAISPAPADGV